MAVGAVYQTVTRWSCKVRYQRSASKSPSSTMHVTPWRQRRDDAVGGAGHPAGVGGAPEDVVGVQVERVASRSRGGRRRPRARGSPPWACPVVPEVKCSSAMSSGAVGGISNPDPLDGEQLGGGRATGHRAIGTGGRSRVDPSNSSTCSSCGELLADRGHLPAVERLGRHQHPPVAPAQALADRLGAERGEQRTEHAAVLQGAERGHVQLQGAVGQHEDAVASFDAEGGEAGGEPVGEVLQLPVGHLGGGTVAAEQAQRDAARRARPVAWRSTAS